MSYLDANPHRVATTSKRRKLKTKKFRNLSTLSDSDDSFILSPSNSTVAHSPPPKLDADAVNNDNNRKRIGLPPKVRTRQQEQFIEALSVNPKNYITQEIDADISPVREIDDDISPARETNLQNIRYGNTLTPNNPLNLSPGSARALINQWNAELPAEIEKASMKHDLNLLKKKMNKNLVKKANNWFKNASPEEKEKVFNDFRNFNHDNNQGTYMSVLEFVKKAYKDSKMNKTKKKSNMAKGRRKRKTYRSKGKCKTGGKRKKNGGNKKRKTRKRNRKRRSRRTRK